MWVAIVMWYVGMGMWVAIVMWYVSSHSDGDVGSHSDVVHSGRISG